MTRCFSMVQMRAMSGDPCTAEFTAQPQTPAPAGAGFSLGRHLRLGDKQEC